MRCIGKTADELFCVQQGCVETAKHVVAMLGNIQERSLGGGQEAGQTGRSKYMQELEAISDRHPALMETFPFGVAFHHAGLNADLVMCLLSPCMHYSVKVITVESLRQTCPAERVTIEDAQVSLVVCCMPQGSGTCCI